MRKIFILVFCFVSVSVFTQEGKYTILKDVTADVRNNVWYWGTNSMEEVDEFLYKFFYFHKEESIMKDMFGSMNEFHTAICKKLLDRCRNIAIPNQTFRMMISCDDNYGVMIFWWQDNSTFGGATPQERLMFREFFKLKNS